MAMRLVELMAAHGLTVGLETAGTRPKSMISWLDWQQAPRVLDLIDAEQLDAESLNRLSIALTLDDETITVIVDPDETEYRNAGAQALLDYDQSVGQSWPTRHRQVTVIGIEALARLQPDDDDVYDHVTAIIEAATRRIKDGTFGQPMAPVSPQAETLAVLLVDALPGWGVDWEEFVGKVRREPELLRTATLLTATPRAIVLPARDRDSRHR